MIQKIKQTPISVILATVVLAFWLVIWGVTSPISLISMLIVATTVASLARVLSYLVDGE